LTNNVIAYNIETLFGFVAAGFFMYWLMRYFANSVVVSIFSAVIFAFCPYHFARAWQYLGLSLIQWLPLYILCLFKLKEKANFSRAFFLAAAFFLVFSFDFYYGYFMVLVTLLFMLYLIIYRYAFLKKESRKDFALKKPLMMFLASGIMAFIFILPTVYSIMHNKSNYLLRSASAHNPYLRAFEDLFAQAARPLSYLLPAPSHPLFGGFTENFVGTTWYGESFTEHVLYLGWVPLVLSFIVLKLFFAQRNSRDNDEFRVGFFLFLAISAWLFSQPPWWDFFGFKIYMPSFFMYKIAPMVRAYCRFGIILMLAVAVLAGFGLRYFLAKIAAFRSKLIFCIALYGLVFFEFWNYPPYKVIDVSRQAEVYSWLALQPGNIIIAEYPLDASTPNEMYKFHQTMHKKRIINGTLPGTFANQFSQTLVSLSDYRTAERLKWMGVKYVLVHRDDYLNTELTADKEELYKIRRNPGLKFIKDFPSQECPQKNIACIRKTGPINVYEVVSAPVKPMVEEK